MIPKNINAQRDFSGGEYNSDAIRRDDSDLVKSGARQMRNWRILNSGAATNRPGRLALFPAEGRVDEVLVVSATKYYLCFGEGEIRIRDSTGAIVASLGGFIWTAATLWQIVWTLVPRDAVTRDIIICYPGQRPWVARWTTPTTWNFYPFNFATNGAGAVLEPFYRLAPSGITLLPASITGVQDLYSNTAYFTSDMVGTTIRWHGSQMRIIGYVSSTHVFATAIETLPNSNNLLVTPVAGTFNRGDIVEGDKSGGQAEVANWDAGGGTLSVTYISASQPGIEAGVDTVVGPSGRGTCTASSAQPPFASVMWDEEVVSNYRGWPGSCFYDQGRLGFCDLPSVPGGISWSAIGSYENHFVGANPSDAMFEIAPSRARVFHVMGKGDELVFTDRGIYFIPVSETNPLKPGSVVFRKIRSDAASQVKPTEVSEGIIFLNSGLNRAIAVTQTGSLTQPWDLRESSLLHSHLFSSPIALAATSSDTGMAERYIYVVNDDGTLVVGRYNVEKNWVGWLPWDGDGEVTWASSLDSVLTLTATYSAGTDVTIAEKINVDQYVDGAILINAVPTAMQAGVDANYYKLEIHPLSYVGSMSTGGPLFFAFDGTINEFSTTCPHDTTPGGATTYGPTIGVQWSSAKIITRVILYAPSNDTFITGGAAGNVKLQGSDDGAIWTDLTGNVALSQAVAGTQDISSGITTTTAYSYHRLTFASAAAKVAAVAEVQLFTTVSGKVHKAPNLGTGALWWLASGTVDLIDGVNPLGTHDVNASGTIVKLFPGEDLTSTTIYGGKQWTATLEPFVPHAQPGQDQQQRMKKRRIARAAISVQNSTGFVFAGRRIPPWNQDDDAGAAPPLREATYSFRPVGRSHDPRKTLTKDMPGPLIVTEISMEVTV